MGGTVGGVTGVTLGGTIPQTAGGHIGRKSIEFSHIACIDPFTHLQTQAAFAFNETIKAPKNISIDNKTRIFFPL